MRRYTPGERLWHNPETDGCYVLHPTHRRTAVMSLRPQPIGSIPEQTVRVAHAAFPKGHPYLTLRDHLGTIVQDEDFARCFRRGAPWGSPHGGWPS
jgi:transposase